MPNFIRYSRVTNTRLYAVNYTYVSLDIANKIAFCVDVDKSREEYGRLINIADDPAVWTFKPVRDMPGQPRTVEWEENGKRMKKDIVVYCEHAGAIYNDSLDNPPYKIAYLPGYTQRLTVK